MTTEFAASNGHRIVRQHDDRGQDFPTHAEANNYAQKEATK